MIVLYYLPMRARAEQIRLIFAYGNIPYEDRVVPLDKWPGHKVSLDIAPFAQLPTLQLPTGEIIAQSGAIARYAAKLAKIYPEDPTEAARADMIYEVAQDMNVIGAILNFWPISSEVYNSNYQAYFESFPRYAKILVGILGDKKFFGGNVQPHFGDFAIFHILDATITVKSDALAEFPVLINFIHSIRSIPSISAYLDSRQGPPHVGLCGSFIQKGFHHH